MGPSINRSIAVNFKMGSIPKDGIDKANPESNHLADDTPISAVPATGPKLELDRPEFREALALAASDEVLAVRREAILGLAMLDGAQALPFLQRVDHSGHLSTRQYARLVDEWVTGVGLIRSDYGTHSLRRTKASIIYRATGNLRAVQILLDHSKIENSMRYLGIDVEDALAPRREY